MSSGNEAATGRTAMSDPGDASGHMTCPRSCDLPPYTKWDDTNSLLRLAGVAYNFYRALGKVLMSIKDAADKKVALISILKKQNLRTFKEEGSKNWVVTSDGSEVLGHRRNPTANLRHAEASHWSDWEILNGGSDTGTAKASNLRFAWSAFPRANSNRKWQWKVNGGRKRDYTAEYINVVETTARHMLQTAVNKNVAAIFNPAGGGAFLRKCVFEKEIGALVPIMLVLGYIRARIQSDCSCTALLLVGMGSTVSILSEARQVNLKEWFGSDNVQQINAWIQNGLPSDIFAISGDMIAAGQMWKNQNPGWDVGINMAGDENSLGNMYLSLMLNDHMPLHIADPWNGARRASDENNTRRTTLMEIAIVFNSNPTALIDYLGEPNLDMYINEMVISLQQRLLLFQDSHLDWSDRSLVLDVIGEDLLTKFLKDNNRFQRLVPRRGKVSSVIDQLGRQFNF